MYWAIPGLSTEVTDTVGAGDAFLSVTAPLACIGEPPEVIGFVGNCVGAMQVRWVGNRESVNPVELYKFITALLRWG
jgi:sugar/nucleoside kinase (ribokinase family)